MRAMNQQMHDVMQHRAELLARIDSQRAQMAEIGTQLESPLALADQGLAAIRFLRSNPMLPAAIAALFLFRRRGMVAMAMGAWRVWKGYRSISPTSAKQASHL